jgi:hypothetical protein
VTLTLSLEKSNVSTSTRDSTIPSTWDMTNGVYNLRINVPVESQESQLVLLDFHQTMFNLNYQPRVIRIERIQNERWFHQYEIHKKEFRRRLQQDTEQRLYHGCADGETAVKSIIDGGFNRSLAGTQHGKMLSNLQNTYPVQHSLETVNCLIKCDDTFQRNF